jgi:exonuclease SbcD
MRILHTADWHLNHRLGRIERNDDIARGLRQIARYLEEYQVDVMVVAGDLFDRGRADELRQGVALMRDIFLPFLEHGGTMVAISGNHDNEIFFETLRDAFDLVMPVRGSGQVQPTGRLYLAPNPRLLRLVDRAGTVVQFALMPYPTASWYLRSEAIRPRSIEEKHRILQDRFTATLEALTSPAHGFDVTQPAVLVSHIRPMSLMDTFIKRSRHWRARNISVMPVAWNGSTLAKPPMRRVWSCSRLDRKVCASSRSFCPCPLPQFTRLK